LPHPGGVALSAMGSANMDRRAVLLLGLGGSLAGCGFQPVYAPSGAGAAPSADLAAIEVKPIYERPGQILREALKGRLGTETGEPSRFDLQVNFWITGEAQGVLDFTQPTRIRLVGNTTWVLSSRDAKQTTLASGNDRVIDGFDIFDRQYFAQDLANEAVQRRIAEAMAERITLHLAVWFHQHPTAT
jgi:LPS-assembly lipoprotein